MRATRGRSPRVAALLVVVALALLAGCQTAPTTSRPALKEVYVEVAAISSEVARKVTFPLDVADEPVVFSSAYRLDGTTARDELLVTLSSDPATGVTLDDPDDPPALLLLPSDILARDKSGIYVGHSAFAASSGPVNATQVIHHIRFLVVNREAEPVRLDLTRVELGDVEAEGAVLERIGGADERGEALDALELLPGDSGLAHVFFTGAAVPERVVLRWRLERRPDITSPTAVAHMFDGSLVLGRRYVADGLLTSLEARLSDGGAIPPPTVRRREPWREPRLDPVMGTGR